jgi:hypothetical protein
MPTFYDLFPLLMTWQRSKSQILIGEGEGEPDDGGGKTLLKKYGAVTSPGDSSHMDSGLGVFLN